MEPVNILDARNNLSKLVASASAGNDVVIANRGKPVVRLVAIEADEDRYTGEAVAQWLRQHPVPVHAARTGAELDEQIVREREAWE